MAVAINIGTTPKLVGLTCGSANPAAQQRRPAIRCADLVVICQSNRETTVGVPAAPAIGLWIWGGGL